jgi:hypothetical protein
MIIGVSFRFPPRLESALERPGISGSPSVFVRVTKAAALIAVAVLALAAAACGRKAASGDARPTLSDAPRHAPAGDGGDQSVKYDDAAWHYGAENFPMDQPESHGFVHIGFYFTWAAERGLVSDFVREETPQAITEVAARRQSPIFLLESWDGKLFDDMLSEEGNAFTSDYYGGKTSAYLTDYAAAFPGDGDGYRVEPSWKNYEMLKPILDRRFEEWQAKRQGQQSG